MNPKEFANILEGRPRRLTPAQVATVVCKSTRTLRLWRRDGIGPEFIRFGKYIRYDEAAVFAWIEAQERSVEERCPTCGGWRPSPIDCKGGQDRG